MVTGCIITALVTNKRYYLKVVLYRCMRFYARYLLQFQHGGFSCEPYLRLLVVIKKEAVVNFFNAWPLSILKYWNWEIGKYPLLRQNDC